MIPLRNKELLIEYLKQGASIQEACEAAQVSRASLYRLFKDQPGFKDDVEGAIFASKDKTKEIQKKVAERNMELVKQIVLKRKQ